LESPRLHVNLTGGGQQALKARRNARAVVLSTAAHHAKCPFQPLSCNRSQLDNVSRSTGHIIKQ